MAMTFEEVLNQCKFAGHTFKLGQDADRFYIQVVSGRGAGRKWFLSPHMTKSEVVSTAFKAALTYQEHETRYAFTYKNKAIFGPHFDVDKLVALCDDTNALDKRNPVV